MKRLRLSIVICTYNGATYLQPQLDSLMAQTLLPDEIVIGDDGSSDGSAEILRAFAVRARQAGIAVRLRRNPENLGYVSNFTSGLRDADGDILFLCDQDDVWHPDKLARMVARFEHEPSLLLLHSDARLVDADGLSLQCSLFDALELTPAEKQLIHDGHTFDVVLRRSFVTGATAAIRRELVAIALPVPPDWIHDEWLAAVAAVTGRLDFIDASLIDYRQHGGNQIGMRKRTVITKWQELTLPRGAFLAAEARRLQWMEAFLERSEHPCAVEYATQIRHKRLHFERRVVIGKLPLWRRPRAILEETRKGTYRRFGTGPRSMLRDLLRHD